MAKYEFMPYSLSGRYPFIILREIQLAGTESNEPQLPIAFDVRELIEGNPEEAVRGISEKDFE